MNVATIEMEPAKAKELWLEYRAAVREQNREEDRDIMTGYKALSEGKKIIDVHQAIARGGCDELGRPKLAIIRADAQWCWLDRHWGNSLRFSMEQNPRNNYTTRFITLRGELFGPEIQKLHGYHKALVPSIPPRFRPKGALENYHILFEAEWQAIPPKDPMLLRHLTGSLYVVLACWDLTELERAVLGSAL